MTKLTRDIPKEPEQEPVATSQATYNKICLGLAEAGCRLSEQQKMALASLVQDTTPPQRTWVGLTDEEIRKTCVNIHGGYEQARAIEALLKEKNT